MGMYAGYYRISDTELEQLRQLEERALLERVEELTEDETAETCDLEIRCQIPQTMTRCRRLYAAVTFF